MDPFAPRSADIPPPGLPPDEDLFDRYFSGYATPAEIAAVRAYLADQHPDAEKLISKPGTLYLDNAEKGRDSVMLWNSVVARIAREVPQRYSNASQSATYRKFSFKHLITQRAAVGFASIALILAFVIPTVLHFGTDVPIIPQQKSEMRSVVAAIGQRVKYYFPDGSSAVMAPGTTLRYAGDFGNSSREILLEGEALFTVVQDGGKPFIVRSAGSSVRVLGTTFSVRRFETDTTMRVVVAQGKVSVAAQILTGGDAIDVTGSGKTYLSRGVDVGSAMSWTTGKLTFKRTQLRDVIPEFERWYGIQMSVTEPVLLDQPITAVFLTEEPEGALNSLSALLRVSIVRAGNHITLEPLK